MADTVSTLRPRRSVLYMPGANERALEKAKGIDADALILDLEDAVSPDAKPEARDRVCAAATSGEYGHRELAIRVNGIGTEWHDADIAAAAQAGPPARRSTRDRRRPGPYRAVGHGGDTDRPAPGRRDRRRG
jgi:citrate lyase subunit beta/citryl-CoA lyase